MSVELPENMGYGQVTARFLLTVADGPDEGRLPDGKAATGKITFTAAPDWMTNITATPPVVIIPKPIECFLDPQGYLIDPEGARGVWLPATDDEDLDPVGWTYMVQIALEGVPRRSFSIAVPEGTTRDLAKLTPVASSTGNAIVRGLPGDSAYKVAVDEGFVGTESAWLESLVGPQGAGVADITTDISVGTRVFVGDFMVYGDTGEREIPLLNGWTALRSRIRRQGAQVSILIQDLDGTAATADAICALPNGFRANALTGPYVPVRAFTSRQNPIPTSGFYVRTASSVGSLQTTERPTSGLIYDTWATDTPWPATLPGSPA